MPIETPQVLIEALRGSGLFSREQFAALLRELSSLPNDLPVLLNHLVNNHRLSTYQLRKVIHGKTAELFIGPYVIVDKLGEGGMGRVYRAWQARIGRMVALKVVRPNLLANRIIRGRYQREVETASTLRHPNIVGVEDAGEIDGKHYLAMEFVDGVDLARLSKDHRPLEIVEACEYARQAALGLQHAHDCGFVHRDIKPSNIIVSGERHVPQATEPALVKILDMGLVRAVGFEEVGSGGNDLTRDGAVVGTPDYMAPEQAKNSSGVDHRADLYSLGCTLYFLLTTQPPFQSDSPIETLIKHQLETPLPLQALRPEIPSVVASVVVRLMAKKPDFRFRTAGEVAEALAPLSVYPNGAQPVPIRVRRPRTAAMIDSGSVSPRVTRPTYPGSSLQPPLAGTGEIPAAQPSDQTPQPAGGALHAAETHSPFSSLTDPPSGPMAPVLATRPEPRVAAPRLFWPWVAAGVVIAGAGVGLLLAFGQPESKQQPTPSGNALTDSGEPQPKPPARHGIVPNVNFARLRPYQELIPDGSGLVAVAFPLAYLRDKYSPYSVGAGPGKLAQWSTRLADNTALPLASADRVVLSIAAARPDQILLVAEGDFITARFADTLSPPKFTPVGKPEKSWHMFALPGGRQVGLFNLETKPFYALGFAPGPVGRFGAHFAPGNKIPSPTLDDGMLPALNPTNENPPPLVVAVVGASCRLPATRKLMLGVQVPAESRTLKEYGLELLTLKARVREKMELELTATGENAASVKQALTQLAVWLAHEHPHYGALLADTLNRAQRTPGETNDGKYRLTLKATWTSEQWSTFLEKLLLP